MKEKILKLKNIKSINYQAVLDILLQSDGLSRVELAKRMGCNNATVTRAVSALIEHGIVVEGEKEEQAFGRPRVTLRINPNGPLLLGLALEADYIIGVLTDLRGVPQEHYRIEFKKLPERKTFLKAVVNVIEHLKGIAKDRLICIGASVFGLYSGEEYTIENAAALPSLNGLELRPFFEKTAGMEVMICDQSVAKMSYLARKIPQLNAGTVMLIAADNGIGSLLLEAGRLIFSRNNHGGELGHTICIPNGMLCSCGRRGCLETVASIPALLRSCREKLSMVRLDYESVCKLYRDGNEIVRREVSSLVDYLGTAISNQLNNIPVDQLVVTGGILRLGEDFQSALEAKIDSILFASVKSCMTVHFFQPEGEDSLACGAAILAEQHTDVIHALLSS